MNIKIFMFHMNYQETRKLEKACAFPMPKTQFNLTVLFMLKAYLPCVTMSLEKL